MKTIPANDIVDAVDPERIHFRVRASQSAASESLKKNALTYSAKLTPSS